MGSTMRRPKIGLVIPHPEEQKWDHVWKMFRMPNLTLPTLAAVIPEEDWEIEIQDELVGPLEFDRAYDAVSLRTPGIDHRFSQRVDDHIRRSSLPR